MNTGPASLTPATEAQLGDLFACGVQLAMQGGQMFADRMMDSGRVRCWDAGWEAEIHQKRLRPTVPDAIDDLRLAGSFVASARGIMAQRHYDRRFYPMQCNLHVDIPKPPGYDIDSFYTRRYQIGMETGKLEGHSAIIEDLIQHNETVESWRERRELERMTGMIMLNEYRSLSMIMRAARLYLARRTFRNPRTERPERRYRLMLPSMVRAG